MLALNRLEIFMQTQEPFDELSEDLSSSMTAIYPPLTTPQSIEIRPAGGELWGVREARFTTRTLKVTEVPRPLLKTFLKTWDRCQLAVYLLFDARAKNHAAQVCVGRTIIGAVFTEFKPQGRKNMSWQTALVLTPGLDAATSRQAEFLEWLCIQGAKSAGKFEVVHRDNLTRPYVYSRDEIDCLDYYKHGSILLSTLGFHIFPTGRPT